jgi:hypothetical protein
VVFSLCSCSAGGQEIATLGTDSPVDTESAKATDLVAQQKQAAQALAECLADLGVETNTAEVRAFDDPEGGFVDIVPIVDKPSYLIVTPGGSVVSTEDYPVSTDTSVPRLVIGDRDLTEEYVACIDSSGYFVPEEDDRVDPREEELVKQKSAEAGNLWAKCARDNGIPDIADVKILLDDFKTKPEVLIPKSVTPDQFKDTLKACPPFDPNRDLAHGNMYEEDEAMPEDPMIGFELPEDDPVRTQLQQILDNVVIAAYE